MVMVCDMVRGDIDTSLCFYLNFLNGRLLPPLRILAVCPGVILPRRNLPRFIEENVKKLTAPA